MDVFEFSLKLTGQGALSTTLTGKTGLFEMRAQEVKNVSDTQERTRSVSAMASIMQAVICPWEEVNTETQNKARQGDDFREIDDK